MKICFLATGDSVHSLRWIDFFAQRGHEIHWVSLEKFTLQRDARIHTYEITSSKSEAFQVIKGVKKLRAIIKNIKPDVLHVHSAGRNGLVSLLSGFHPRIVTAWGSEVLIAGKSKLIRPLIKSILQSADLVTCDAEHMRHAISNMGVNKSKIRIVYFGTDTDKFQPKQQNNKIKTELGIGDGPSIISLRSLEPLYSIETLLHAARYVLKYIPNTVFIIAGDGSEKGNLISLAKSLNIDEHVRFIGQIPNQILSEYLSCADVYVSTSLSDAGLAASTAEAMACGLPVVVTDSGENRLWVEENKGGFVVATKDPDSMAKRILSLLKNPVLQKQFGLFNRSIIEKRNNYNVEMSKMGSLYEGLLR